MEELTLQLPSGRVEAVAHGAAGDPLVICVHGLSANARAWDAIAADLARDGRRVVAIDARGRGRSEVTAPGTYGMTAHAADVLAVANELEAEVFDYVGWSMGALIGIVAASTGAGRLRRLVLIDHAGRMDDAAMEAVRAGLARLEAVVDDPADYVRALREAGAIERWDDQWDAMYRRELAQRDDGRWAPRTSRAACEEDIADFHARDWTEAWRPLVMPTLLVRALRPLNGGLVVPDAERDGIAARARDLTLVEVDANHFDVMTEAGARTSIRRHLH
jgi:pimeloyl-ACP methyl ester carboxylesterase